MLSARLFWLLSLALLGFSLVVEFTVRRFVAFGFIGDILFYGAIIGFLGFMLRQRWGYLLVLIVQILYLVTFVFPQVLIFETIAQVIGIGILFMSKSYFSQK
ncbi:MAG: hypothetical protein ABIH20_06110 [Candidatus Diapherotrites archaeon]